METFLFREVMWLSEAFASWFTEGILELATPKNSERPRRADGSHNAVDRPTNLMPRPTSQLWVCSRNELAPGEIFKFWLSILTKTHAPPYFTRSIIFKWRIRGLYSNYPNKKRPMMSQLSRHCDVATNKAVNWGSCGSGSLLWRSFIHVICSAEASFTPESSPSIFDLKWCGLSYISLLFTEHLKQSVHCYIYFHLFPCLEIITFSSVPDTLQDPYILSPSKQKKNICAVFSHS